MPIKGLTPEQNNKICAISAMTFRHIINNANKYYGNVQQFALSLNEINTALQATMNDKLDIKEIVPHEYYKYLKIFKKVNTDQLPLYCPCDHKIPLQDGF
jgi:hypothetical protein